MRRAPRRICELAFLTTSPLTPASKSCNFQVETTPLRFLSNQMNDIRNELSSGVCMGIKLYI